MGTATGVLPLPAFGSRIAVRTKVDYQNSQEGALVRRAQSGDEAAFREIVERYQSKVFSIIHGIVRQRNDVEDIAQQVFTKVYFSIRNFDFRSSLITWIYKITVNECFDYLRKKKPFSKRGPDRSVPRYGIRGLYSNRSPRRFRMTWRLGVGRATAGS